jgi:hypothetical protein
VLPVKRIDGSLVMVHQYAAHALIELLEVGKTPSSPDLVLQHAPETCNRIQMVAASRGQKMPITRLMPARKRRRACVRPMAPTALDHHHDLLPRAAKEGHHLMDRLAKPLGIKRGDNCIEPF